MKITIYAFLLFTITLYGQNKNHFINLNREDGLSSNFITAIHQDKYGYMWFGSTNGLNRYDGHRIKTYLKNDNPKNSISNNFTIDILYTTTNKLLICSSSSIDVYNYKTEKFTPINIIGNYSFSGIIENKNQEICILTSNNAILIFDKNLNLINTIDLKKGTNNPNSKRVLF